MHDPQGFARRLDQIFRLRRVGKMYALAVELGIDESALSRWRRGKPISVENLVRLSGHLRVSIDWLLTGTGPMELGEASAADAWRSEVVADLATLEPVIRDRLAELMRRLADARRPKSGLEKDVCARNARAEPADRPDRLGANA